METSGTDRGWHLARSIEARCRQRGWDVAELARQARISRTTAHLILSGNSRQPRRSTLARLARALEISPAELAGDARSSRGPDASPTQDADEIRRFDQQTNPVIGEVCAESPHLFQDWEPADWDELYSTFGVGGALTEEGVRQTARAIQRKRETIQQVRVLLETHLAEVVVRIVGTLSRMVQPVGNLEAGSSLDALIARHRVENPGDE